jgi:exportin-T
MRLWLEVRDEYPSQWPRFFHELIGLLSAGGEGAADVFCRILDAVDDEVISTGDTLHAGGGGGTRAGPGVVAGLGAVAPSVRVKDAMREDGDCLAQLAGRRHTHKRRTLNSKPELLTLNYTP